jgi:hypothetical protein
MCVVGTQWVGPGGWEIEAIILDRVPTLRIRQRRTLRAYCRTKAELDAAIRRYRIPVADLLEVRLPGSGGRR